MSDLISRHAVMNRIENEYREWGDEYDALQILGDIEDFPSVESKHGKWIKADSQQYFRKHYPCFTCSECGYRKESQKKWNYCPNCGSRMEE